LESRNGGLIGLQIDRALADQSDHQSIDEDTSPAEHAAHADRPERGEQLHDVVEILIVSGAQKAARRC
jgi:hypothetical protein